MLGQLDRLYRRLLMAIGRGETRVVDDTKPVQMVQVFFGPLETRDNTPRVGEYGLVSNPPSGTDCVVLFVGGDRDNGVIVATNNKAARKKNLAPGEVALHNDKGDYIHFKADRTIEVVAGTKVKVTSPIVEVVASTKVTLTTPLVECSGDLTATGTITATVDVVGGGKHLKTHVHSGVTAGGANTGQPV